ncbi:hypothetical protein Pcinc_031664 [Petrolisthes cinctipes]|uniref:Metallothionein n=1 Tax=Petrolisthes cinctipes TaxID=88211 RepID=A0AAE1K2Q1_PETCI|nr:hypothetical protein Pcinc_031664 [Petrolisthes cinctipes]
MTAERHLALSITHRPYSFTQESSYTTMPVGPCCKDKCECAEGGCKQGCKCTSCRCDPCKKCTSTCECKNKEDCAKNCTKPCKCCPSS